LNSSIQTRADLPRVPYRQAPLVLLALVLALLAITWPWAKTFATGFLQHWDPPFHAWKLEYVARAILGGHLLPPDGNTNMYYPHPGTLYFEALHWPQALVAAPLFALPHANPILIYHLVLVFFWALSGLCFWMLLHALGTTRAGAWLGALLFVLMPYRISYMVEFNMQLCFGVPLFFFFLVRYFQRPSIRYACGAAVAWWLQASSELYQAVFLLLVLPFLGLALLAGRGHLLRSVRRFWLPALCAAALGGILTWHFLGPYLTLLNVHAVNRNLLEIATHVLEPLSYLRPGGRFHLMSPFDTRRDEMIVYPTATMLLLATVYLAWGARDAWRRAAPRWIRGLRAIHVGALLAFMLLTFVIYHFGAPPALGTFYAALPVVAVLASALLLLHPARRDVPARFAAGLFAGAVFAYFMSFGPLIALRHPEFIADNVLYLWIYKHLSALQGFRVVSRFSLYVLLFLATAAALGWSRIERRWPWRRAGLPAAWAVLLALAVLESVPHPLRIRPLRYPPESAVLDGLDRRTEPYVIAMAPMGNRNSDSRHMLTIARSDRLFVYAWGGAYPSYTQQVRDALNPVGPRPDQAAALLRQLWPDCLILEDKHLSRLARVPVDYAERFAGLADVVAEDERYALLQLRPNPRPDGERIRLVRRDYLAAHPVLTFRARVPAGAPPVALWLDVNGYPAGRWTLTADPQDGRVAVPAAYFVDLLPNRFRFHAEGDAAFILDDFNLAAPGSDLPPPADPALFSAKLPWLGHIEEVPETAVPLDVSYRNGFEILACEPLETIAAPGGTIRLRYYVRAPRALRIAANVSVRTRLRAPNGQWIEEGISLADTGDLQDLCCQLQPGIYDLEQVLAIPERLPPGDYELSVLLRNHREKRLAGIQNGHRAKLFPVPIPIRIQAPAAP
jgi:hypothetical protein